MNGIVKTWKVHGIPVLSVFIVCTIVFSGFTCRSIDPMDDDNGEIEASFLVLSADDGLADSFVTDLLYDPDRNGVWIATVNGISFFDNTDSSLTTFGAEEDIPDLDITSLEYDFLTGDILAGTAAGASVYNDAEGWSMYEDMLGRYITDIHVHSDGSIWFATRTGIEVFTNTGRISYTVSSGLSHNTVNAFAEQSDGTLWIGTQYGLNSYKDGVFNSYSESLLPSPTINTVVVLSDDSVWFGTSNGVAVYRDGNWSVTGTSNGLPYPVVNDFVYSIDGVFYTATDGGAARYSNGTWYSVDLPDRVSAYAVSALECDQYSGALWFGTRGGTARYDSGIADQ